MQDASTPTHFESAFYFPVLSGFDLRLLEVLAARCSCLLERISVLLLLTPRLLCDGGFQDNLRLISMPSSSTQVLATWC